MRANGYTEVKNRCEEGECGACMVLIDVKAIPSCQVLAVSGTGCSLTAIQGLGTIFDASVIQKAFVDAGAVQCGFCTPGMILAAYLLLKENPDPGEKEIASALDGNLCRCTGYVKIIDAVQLSARRLSGGV